MDPLVVYSGAVLLAGVLALAMAVWLWRRDDDVQTKLFAVILAFHPAIGGLLVARLTVAPASLASDLFTFESALVAAVPLLWLVFTVLYVDRREWLSRPALAALGAYYVTLVALGRTNSSHQLLYTGFRTATTPFPHLAGIEAQTYLLVVAPVTLAFLVGMALLGHHALRSDRLGRWQTVGLVVGFSGQLVVIGASNVGALPGPDYGYYVIGSSWAAAFVGWAVFRYRLFDVTPVARRTVIDELDEAVLAVGGGGRLRYYNVAARALFPDVPAPVGLPLETLLPAVVDDAGGLVDEFDRYGEDGPGRSPSASPPSARRRRPGAPRWSSGTSPSASSTSATWSDRPNS